MLNLMKFNSRAKAWNSTAVMQAKGSNSVLCTRSKQAVAAF
jgi:hypothetical protein